MHFFDPYIRNIDSDFISVMETGMHSLLSDGAFSIDGYNLFHKDNTNHHGSDMGIHIRSRFLGIPCEGLNKLQHFFVNYA